MKKILSYIMAAVAIAAVSASCSNDNSDNVPGEGKGQLVFTVDFGGEAITRAEAPGNCNVKVATAEGKVVYEYTDLADIPAQLWLTSGDYIVVAEGGTKAVSGWDAPFYKGSETFTISAGQTTSVSVNCLLQNALFTVDFDESVTGPMSGYSVTLIPVADDDSYNLVFDGQNPGAVGYVLPSASLTSVGWAFAAEHEDYGTVAKTGTIAVEARKKYELTFKYTPQTGDFALDFTITVDEEPIDEVAHNIPIFQRPKLTAVGFDLSQTQLPADSYEIAATASSDIASIVLTGSVFGAQGIDLLADDLTDTGVNKVIAKANKISVFLTSELFDKLSGSNEITITVTDANGKTNSAVFRIETSGIDPVSGAKNIWATFANVSASVLEEGTNNVRFAYRPASGGDWEYVDGTEDSEGKYTAKLTGLTPSTAYEAALEVNGQIKSVLATFTTDAAPPLPNGGFENWYKDNNTWYPNANSASYFWDTANPGLTLANGDESNKNPTMSSTDVRRDSDSDSDGILSAHLSSKKITVLVVKKFAAGNIYTGEFAGINLSPAGGKVKFGRPFTARPSALKGWYKSNVGIIDEAESGAPVGTGVPDAFQIYACLTTWSEPHQVNSWDPSTYIKFDDSDILAYGELTSSTTSDWTDFYIPLKYKATDVQPTYIVVVACASKYGDYLTGSTSSWLKVDDFELVYDENIVLQK